MNEQQIRQIVNDEIKRQMFQSGKPQILVHQHNGVDSPQIPQSSVVFPTPINGSIDMNSQKTYTLGLTGKQIPSSVTFYGSVINTTSTPKVHAMVVGNAQYGSNQQFQPSSTSAVATGPVVETIIQGSAAIIVENTTLAAGPSLVGGNTITKNSQGHIIYVEYPSGATHIVAQADILSITSDTITVQVTTLSSNWSISGLWIVT